MGLNNPVNDYKGKIETLKRRRDYLDRRIADYQGKDASRDRAESSAIDFALEVIESDYEKSLDILTERRARRST